jgi:hypothetical protein
MTALPARDLPGEILLGYLRGHAAGLHRQVAAIGLLADHATWIPRLAGHGLITVERRRGYALASIDWDQALLALEAKMLPCSGSEASILKIAASLACGEPASLGPELTSLDIANAWRVTTAVWAATGHDAWDLDLPGEEGF